MTNNMTPLGRRLIGKTGRTVPIVVKVEHGLMVETRERIS